MRRGPFANGAFQPVFLPEVVVQAAVHWHRRGALIPWP